ncbi:MAG: PROBABLE REMNANT OF A TRANSPOSASE GENE PROTEIN [uncultured Sulfurovum sp.]|uniref:PROBABLE REMNANT OF A TRANSPOSASE GENE PROTEIN n=1 Tax=uncultured Sulfurovum sp. TaxID=269237 RepID=A0A6S6UL21_9BACT|nr:MAG: PROBABLE REMNANT OF A TRANSPOSASE GENE PROTEIN [uncultured Sulfurovum sp.]
MPNFPLENVTRLREELAAHPIYDAVKDMNDLSIFMQHHVYSVWDFMSLVKYLQNEIAPAKPPWLPFGDAAVQRFINDIVLEEESDEGLPLEDGTVTYTSHFNLYTQAMEEVKEGSSQEVKTFIAKVASDSFDIAKETMPIPTVAKSFMQISFDFIDSQKPHVVAAVFALGREHIIPEMFRALLEKMNVPREQAQVFHYYLDRHIELDSDHHGPMSLRMLDLLCEGSEAKIAEAEEAALHAIRARIQFWDGVLIAINAK